MSYSFSVTAGSKADARQKIADQFDAVVASQPSHATDRAAAVACAQAFVDTLAEPGEGDAIHVSVHGSLSWRQDTPDKFISASVGVSATLHNTSR